MKLFNFLRTDCQPGAVTAAVALIELDQPVREDGEPLINADGTSDDAVLNFLKADCGTLAYIRELSIEILIRSLTSRGVKRECFRNLRYSASFLKFSVLIEPLRAKPGEE